MQLYRKERKGDRSRRRISTPRESVTPTFKDGMVYVECRNTTTTAILQRRHGFAPVLLADTPAKTPPIVPTPKPTPKRAEPPATRAEELKAKSVKFLRQIAKELGIYGRSKMNEDELISEIVKAEG